MTGNPAVEIVPGLSTEDVRVRGNATPEEVAAVLATVASRRLADTPVSGYQRWRQIRLAALRR